MLLNFFRPRSAERDRAGDEDRYSRLLSLLDKLSQECLAEADGLRKRYSAAQQNASWALHKMEAEAGHEKLESTISEYEQAMVYCEGRTASLRRDGIFFDSLRENLTAYREERGVVAEKLVVSNRDA